MEFNYLGVNITSSRNPVQLINIQAQKSDIVAGCLNDLVWRKKCMRRETILKTYEANLRSTTT